MDELARRIGRAKAAIDNGFSRLGPEMAKADERSVALWAAAGRAVHLSDAALLLCRHHHEREAAWLVRALLAVAWTMRWLVRAEPEEVRVALERELRAPDWARLWSEGWWRDRVFAAGITDREWEAVRRETEELDVSWLEDGFRGLPWAHLLSKRSGGPDAEAGAVLRLAWRGMRDAVSALEARWAGAFPEEKN